MRFPSDEEIRCAEISEGLSELEHGFNADRAEHEQMLRDIDSAFEHCQFCGKPVPPLAEVHLGTHFQRFSDPNPVCEDCLQNGVSLQKIELPF